MARATTGESLTTALVEVFNADVDGGPCAAVVIGNRSASSGNVLVNIPGLHRQGEFGCIPPGQQLPYKIGGGITHVSWKSDGTATADFQVVS